MKLLERRIVAESGDFIYGVDVFDDQMTIPWMKLNDNALVGQAWTWINGQWQKQPKHAAIV